MVDFQPQSSDNLIRTLAALIGVCLFAQGAYAQVFVQHSSRIKADAVETLDQRKAAIQENERFLGWKLASQAHRDTSRWIQRKSPPQAAPANRSHQSTRPVGSAPAGFGNAGFLWRATLPGGFIPTAITDGDFDEDGKLDFAISNGGDNTIYVFLGNGDGTFQVPEILYTQGQSPTWITSARLHTNGHLDLAVTDGDTSTVEIFPGNGDGTFQASTQVWVPQIPTFILTSDANNDGNQDLVIGLTIAQNLTQPQFEILLGDGAGGFSGNIFSPAIYGNPDFPVPTNWIAAGDVNNDGLVDFVTTVSGGISYTYLNQSGLSFLPGIAFSPNNGAADAPLVAELGDMDEDGCLDLVTVDLYTQANIAKGTCDGNFPTSSVATPVGDSDPAVKLVDVDGDGHLDVVASAVWYGDGEAGYGAAAGYLVSVLKGDGQGNLGLATVYRGGTSAYSLIVDDFTGDGYPEILTANALENDVSLFVNDRTGKYGDPQGETIGYVGGGPINAPIPNSATEVVDLNSDGRPDLLLVENGLDCCLPSQLAAVMNDGTGHFLPVVRTPITVGDDQPVPKFIAGAFRTTAALDVIYINTYNGVNSVFNVAFFQGNGDGTFASPVTITTLPNPQQIVAGDFNGDGKLDFAVVGTNLSGQSGELDVFLGNGDGTFTHLAPQLYTPLGSITDLPVQVIAVDLNHDGKIDLLIGLNENNGSTSNDGLVEALGNGDGTFQIPTVLYPDFGAVAVADVNGDGYPDLIQDRDPATRGNTLYSGAGMTVYLGSANGTFRRQPSYDLSGVTIESYNPALVGDFNGDGIVDVALWYWPVQPIENIEPLLVVLQGVGDGTFIVSGHNYQLPGFSMPFVAGDLNGDGTTDLVDLVGLTSSFTTIPAASGPALDIALDTNPIIGNSGSATVTLDLPATSPETVTLTASDPAIQLPPSVSFAAGQQTQDIAFTLGSGFDSTHVFALYATLGTQTSVAYGTKPNPNLREGNVTALLYNSQGYNVSVEPGESFQMYFQITSNKYSGTFSSLQCIGFPPGMSCSFSPSSIPISAGGIGQTTVTVNTPSTTPFSTQTVTVSATDGVLAVGTDMQLGIGDFSLSLNPTTIVVGPTGTDTATLSSTGTNGLDEQINVSCTGLPAGLQCATATNFYTFPESVGLSINYSQLVANDYPFQITGTADIVSHTIDAVLRVGDFTVSLDKTTATLSAGQSATFNVTLTSVNHYTSSITVSCQPASTTATCVVSPLPAALGDGATTTVQLTVKNALPDTEIRRRAITRFSMPLVVALFIPVGLAFASRRKGPILATLLSMVVIGIVSCGGGNSGGGDGGGGGGGGGNPQTVSIAVVAEAANTPSDTNNQKTLGPIVVTLQ